MPQSSMKNLLIQNPTLVLALAFVVGWTAHWILGLLFFRSRYFKQEAQIAKQARDLEESRFNLGRTQTDLRSKSDLLDAVQRAKTASEQKALNLESDLNSVRGQLAIAQAEVLSHSAASQAAQNRLVSESERPTSGSTSLFDRSDEWQAPERDAEIATLQGSAKHWENRCAELEADLNDALRERKSLQAGVASAQSVSQSLQAALGSRDSTIAALKADLAQRESERESVANALSSADTERQRLKEQLETARLNQERDLRVRTSSELTRIEQENRDLREEMDSLMKANESLNEQLQARTPTSEEDARSAPKPLVTQPSPQGSTLTSESMLADLENVSRERNELAAELASLKATLASLPAGRKSPTRSNAGPNEPKLL